MSRRLLFAVFEREEDLLGATQTAQEQGLRILDVYAPYAVHGLDRVLGLSPSRLSRLCLACGLLGTVLAFGLQYWTSAIDWPINVGGRPWNSWPAFVPVAFELMVLFAGLGVVLAFLIVSRLYPGKKAIVPVPDPTGSRFVLVVEEADAMFDPARVRLQLREFNAVLVEEREVQPPPLEEEAEAERKGHRGNRILAFVFVGLVVLNWTIRNDPSRPNREFLPDMAHSPAYHSYSPSPDLPNEQTLQPPAPGTIPRGHRSLHYQATPEDALRAGNELRNPLDPADTRLRERGAFLFGNYCAVCHGAGGKGDGPVAQRTILKPKSLLEGNAVQMKDGQLFHVLTYGQGSMASYAPQLSAEDRWRVILHVRALQKQPGEKGKP